MKCNKILFLTIVLMAILSLGAVSAQDNGTDDVTSVSQDNTIQLNDDSKLSDDASTTYNKTVYVDTAKGSDTGAGSEASPYETINRAISDVNASDNAAIYLGSGTYSGDNNTNLKIDLSHIKYGGSLSFIGAEDGTTVIDGSGDSPIFAGISSDSIVTLKNIIFKNGKANMGSVVTSAGDLTIDNCLFEENYATNLGAVYSENGNLTITNSKFYKNSGNQYVDLYFSHAGLVTLINNTFDSGAATSSWADTPAVYVGTGKSVIKGNTFKNLTSSRSGAALAVRYNNDDNIANITDNTFINCTYTGSNGGIVFFQNSYLKGNKFINCTSTTATLYSVTDFNSKVTFEDVAVDGTRFTLKANVTDDMGNTAQGAKVIFTIDGANVGTATSSEDGVASMTVNKLLENGEHTISGTQAYSNVNAFDVTVINGTAKVDFDHTPAEVWVSTDGNDITGNGSEDNPFLTLKKALDYGTAATVDLTVRIKNGLYNGSENRDLSYSNVGKITIIGESYGNVIIDAEHASSGSGWWASGSNIFTFGQNLEIKLVNLTLINCDGNPVAAYGLTMNDNIVINSSTIRAQSPNNGVFIDNIKIINGTNQAINAYNLVLTNSLIENCDGKTSTGLLWLSTSEDNVLHLENNTFRGNTIDGYTGGAAYYIQSDLVSINNTFDSNTVTGTSTSSIAYATGNYITSINDKFINNEVPNYVAQYRSNGNYASEIIVENITFINNKASVNGAGLATTGAKIKGGKFINNTAAENGGAIYLSNHGKTSQVSEMSIEDVVFENNTAACGKDIFIAPAQGSNVFANLNNLTITANSKNVTELSDILTVTVSHPSGAIIGGGQVTFYFNGDIVGKADLINQNATLEYVGFKNDTDYAFSSIYEYASENDTYVNGTVSTNIAEALESIELYVSDSLGDDENGTGSESNPFKSISKALSEGYSKSTNITVHVLEGNYTGELNTNLRIPTTVDVLLVGEDVDKVIISDSTADYFITALAGNAKLTLANVTINRAARDTQSAIYVEEGANMEIDNAKFIGGQGNYGGAINTAGTLTINNSYFLDNGYGDVSKRANAYYGGAIYNDGILIIDNSTFEANHAGRLSTIANQGTLYIKNSNVIDSLNAYAMNMDLVAIGAFGGQKGNITIENTIFTVTNRTVDELSNRIYNPQNSLTCLAIGSCEHATIINTTFENQGARYTPNAFGGLNSWNLAGGGYTMVPGDIDVFNSTFRNLQAVSLFYTRTDGSSYASHRLFDGCLFENVEYIIAAVNAGNFSVKIQNSVILSDDVAKIGIASGKTLDMDISNNWWGTNNATFKNATIRTANFISNYVLKLTEVSSEVVNPENYLVLALNQSGNDVELAFKSFDGENLTDYEGSLPAREFTINATGAVLGINNGTIASKVTIPVSVDGENYEIEATVDNETVNLTVVRKDTQISIDSINKDLSINGTLTDIDGNPISNAVVSYEIGDVKENVTTDENGNFNIPCVANGDVLIKFEGTGSNFGCNKTFTFDGVVKENSTTVITVPEEIEIGDDVVILVSVENATGSVNLVVDGAVNVLPLENGIATYIMNAVSAGEHSIVAVYSGDDALNPSFNVTSFNLEEFTTQFVNLTVDGSGFIDGVLVNGLGDVMNNTVISYTLDGVQYNTTTNEDGAFLINITDSSILVELSYAGDKYFLPTNTSIKLINVAPTRTATVVSSKDFSQYACDYYEGERGGNFTFQLFDMMGNPLANKTIYIGYNGVTLNRTTDANGFANVQINLKNAGLYTFVVVFLGDKDYNASMAVHKITINKKTTSIAASAKTFKATAKTKKYTVTLKTIKGSSIDGKTYLAKGKKVTLTINGKTYTAKTNAKGQATFSLKITKKGKFATAIKFAGDNTYKAASKSVKITIK